MNSRNKEGGRFVNDLLRTEFHKKFMTKFIKVCLEGTFRPINHTNYSNSSIITVLITRL